MVENLVKHPLNTHSLAHLIASRRTIHKFVQTPISREILLGAIEAARWAPNHKLTEPWRFYILGPKTQQAAAELNARYVLEKKSPQVAAAKLGQWLEVPQMILVTFQKSGDTYREKEDYAATCCAIQNLSLYLWAEEVGVKWWTSKVTFSPAFYELMGIDPKQEEIAGLLWCGYPEEIPLKDRKPVADIYKELP